MRQNFDNRELMDDFRVCYGTTWRIFWEVSLVLFKIANPLMRFWSKIDLVGDLRFESEANKDVSLRLERQRRTGFEIQKDVKGLNYYHELVPT